MAGRKTRKSTAEDAGADRAALEAFYMRVMHRVCRAYRERSGNGDAAALLEQQWAECMAGYTGELGDDGMGDADLDLVDSLVDPGFASLDHELDALLPSALEPAAAGPSGSPADLLNRPHESIGHVGQPLAHMPPQGLPVPSMFAKMLGAKRPFSQLDGPADNREEADDDLFPDLADPRRRRVDQAATPADGHPAVADSSSSGLLASLDPTSELLPVSSLSVSQFPLQLSAFYSKFGYRNKQQGYAGEVHGAILTIPTPIAQTESVAPGHLLWRASSHADGVGGMVEVISRDDERQTIEVKTVTGSVEVLPIVSAFRLKECIVPKGTVRFHE